LLVHGPLLKTPGGGSSGFLFDRLFCGGGVMRDTIEMAREAGLLTWLKPPEDVIERFKAFEVLVRADERKIVMNEPLTKEMWQRFEDEIRADEREQGQKWFDAVTAQHKAALLAERNLIAALVEQMGIEGYGTLAIAAAIRTRRIDK
jgi:hypothetical protein